MAKRERTYMEISSSYNPDLRLVYFDKYREVVTRKENLDEPIQVKCYVIDEEASGANEGTKYKVIKANIVAIERVVENGELLFRCTCNPEDFIGIGSDKETRKQYKKSFFHRLERMMIEVI